MAAPPETAARIEELLDGSNPHSLEESLEIQLDILSTGARELLPILDPGNVPRR